MKRTIVLGMFVVAVSLQAYGEEGFKDKLIFEIGGEYASFEYEEEFGGSTLMTEEGSLPGLRAQITSYGGLFWQLSARYSAGDLEYEGQYQDGTPVTADTEDYIVEFRALLGADLTKADPNTAVPIFTGLGFRYWNDEIDAPGGYERETTYVYLPIGIEYTKSASDGSRWGVRGEADILLGGFVTSHLSDVDPDYPDIDNTQDSGYGMRASLFYMFPIGKKTSLSLEGFARYWSIDDSDVVLGVMEPANTTTVYGLAASLVW